MVVDAPKPDREPSRERVGSAPGGHLRHPLGDRHHRGGGLVDHRAVPYMACQLPMSGLAPAPTSDLRCDRLLGGRRWLR
jgi:hypothetical protein